MLRRIRVDLVLGVGSSHSVPMLVAARLPRRRTAYVESATRVAHLSATGRIVYGLRLASLFVVQWPSLQRAHPRSRLGTIL